jgi:hypothetical protein
MTKKGITVYEIVIVGMTGALWFVVGLLGIFFTIMPGIAIFWPPTMLNAPFGAWFGVWGALGVLISDTVLCPLWGLSLPVSFGEGLAEAVEVMIPAIAYIKLFGKGLK